MFNIQNLINMASQAMLRKLVSSDAMYQQWCAFSKKMGIPATSRAEFDSLVSQFNSTDANAKMLQRAKQSDTMLLCTVRNRLVSSKLSLLRKEL